MIKLEREQCPTLLDLLGVKMLMIMNVHSSLSSLTLFMIFETSVIAYIYSTDTKIFLKAKMI